MSILDAFILGLTQGLTEFLPVSSSGHLIIASKLLGVTPSLGLELVMHLATLLAVLVYYRKSVWKRLKNPLEKNNLYLLAASCVTAAVAFGLRYALGDMQNDSYLPFFFILTAAVLILGSAFSKNGKITLWKSLAVGLAQGIAVIPGLSRSGTTVSVAMMIGVNKKDATEFSFLLSVPIIIGSSLVELVANPLNGIEFAPLVVGLITAFLSGIVGVFIADKVFVKKSPAVFAPYLMLLASILFFAKL